MTELNNAKEIKNVVKEPEPIKKPTKVTKAELKYESDRDKELVKGVFKFHENPGETMKFYFRAHEGEIEKYELKDGELCEVPLAVARHLNKNCWVPVDQYALDKNGLPTTEIGKKVRRCSFYAINYVELDDLSENGCPMLPGGK